MHPVSSSFTHVHPILSTFTNCHPLLSTFINFYHLLSTFIQGHPPSKTFIYFLPLSSTSILFHPLSSPFILFYPLLFFSFSFILCYPLSSVSQYTESTTLILCLQTRKLKKSPISDGLQRPQNIDSITVLCTFAEQRSHNNVIYWQENVKTFWNFVAYIFFDFICSWLF